MISLELICKKATIYILKHIKRKSLVVMVIVNQFNASNKKVCLYDLNAA